MVLGTFYDQDRSDGPPEFTPHGWGELEHIDPNTTDGVGTRYAPRTLGSSIVSASADGRRHVAVRAAKFAGGNQAKPAYDRGRVLGAEERARQARPGRRLSHHRRAPA